MALAMSADIRIRHRCFICENGVIFGQNCIGCELMRSFGFFKHVESPKSLTIPKRFVGNKGDSKKSRKHPNRRK